MGRKDSDYLLNLQEEIKKAHFLIKCLGMLGNMVIFANSILVNSIII